MGFANGSVWMRSSWALITIGFVVWLAAGGVFGVFASNTDMVNALNAFLIIGVLAYYSSVLLTFLFLFIEETQGHKIVLIVDIVMAFIAAISAIIILAIGQTVNFSDRMAYSAICAIVTGVFCVLELVGGVRKVPAGGAGGTA